MFKQPHGGNVKAFSEEIGCHIEEVIDLSSNINFVKPQLDIDFNTLNIASYPNYEALQEAIAKLYGVQHQQVELFNGATTAIYTLFRKLSLNHATLYAPCYGEYKKAAEASGYQLELIDRFEEIDREPKEGSLVIFVNPSTPDGKFYSVEKLMERWITKGCTIFIDESFLDFTPFESVTNYLKSYDKLYVLKSMTKFYSAAGIRVGAILSTKENVLKLQKGEPIWKISEFDSHYLQSALRDSSFSKKSQEQTLQQREALIALLESSSLIETIYPSSTNFLMVKLNQIRAEAFQKRVAPFKIMVRDCSNFSFLDDRFVRIAVKNSHALEQLKLSLHETVVNV
jgi:threonine-phosphate decarboxylase